MLSKEGGRTPRFRVVATEGGSLQFHADHIRKIDLETIAGDLDAQVVYLPEQSEGKGEEKKKEHKAKQGSRVKRQK
jgi:hypothetical protein